MFDRDSLLNDLRNGVIEVHFTKVDGSQRAMRCTLKKNLLPVSYQQDVQEQNEETGFHQRNPEVIACWSTGDNGWRSFRVDSVIWAQAVDVH